MGYNNGSIFAPVSIHDVQQVLGSGSTDLGTLCRLANINKWARYKPYNYNAIGAAFRPSASDTISKLAGIMFGLTVPQHASLSDMNVAVVNEQSYWSYTGKPVGGQQSPGSCHSWAFERGFSSCGTQAQLLHGIWDLPGPGIEPVSPALADRFLSTALPVKSSLLISIAS